MKFPVASRRELNLYRLKKGGTMKLNLFILVFALGFLTACENKKISNLEDQMQDLEEQLKEATDVVTISKLQIEFKRKQIALVQEKENEKEILFAELQKTTDKESCEILALKIKKLNKEAEDLLVEHVIILPLFGYSDIVCTDQGFPTKSLPLEEEDQEE